MPSELIFLLVALIAIALILAGLIFLYCRHKKKKEFKKKHDQLDAKEKRNDSEAKESQHKTGKNFSERSTEPTEVVTSSEKKADSPQQAMTFDELAAETRAQERAEESKEEEAGGWRKTAEGQSLIEGRRKECFRKPKMLFEAPPSYEVSMGKTPPPRDCRSRMVPLSLPEEKDLQANRPKIQTTTAPTATTITPKAIVSGSTGASAASFMMREGDTRSSGQAEFYDNDAGRTPIINSPMVPGLMLDGSSLMSFTPNATTNTTSAYGMPVSQYNPGNKMYQ